MGLAKVLEALIFMVCTWKQACHGAPAEGKGLQSSPLTFSWVSEIRRRSPGMCAKCFYLLSCLAGSEVPSF